MYSIGGAISAFVPPLRINSDASGAYNKQGRANCISRQTLLLIQEKQKTKMFDIIHLFLIHESVISTNNCWQLPKKTGYPDLQQDSKVSIVK